MPTQNGSLINALHRLLLPLGGGSQFRRNFIGVAQANALALVLPILATPLLSRLYTPDDFGALGVFVSILTFAQAFCTWRFDWSLPNARSRTMAANLMVLGLSVSVFFCIASSVILIFYSDTLLGALGFQIKYFEILLPLVIIASGGKLMFSSWFVRQGDLSIANRATVVQSVSNAGLSIAGGLAHLGGLGLIGSAVLSTAAGVVTMAKRSSGQLAGWLLRVTPFSLAVTARRFSREATWSTLVAVLNAVSLSAPLLLLAWYYSPRDIGWYALMFRLLAVPAAVFGSAISQSFWSVAAELARTRRVGELNHLYKKTTLRLGLFCIPLVLGCLAGPLFIGRLLGVAEWQGAGYVLQAMTPLLIGSLVFSPTNHLVVFSRQSLQTLVDGIRLLLVAGSIVLAGTLELGFITAVALSSFSSLASHAILLPLHLRIHRQHG